jgi:hypothetical protein
MGAVPTIIFNALGVFVSKIVIKNVDKKYSFKKSVKLNNVVKVVAVVLAFVLLCFKFVPIGEFFEDISGVAKYGYANPFDNEQTNTYITYEETVSENIEEVSGKFVSSIYIAGVSSIRSSLSVWLCLPLGNIGIGIALLIVGVEASSNCFSRISRFGGSDGGAGIAKSIFSGFQDNRPEFIK